MLKKKFYFKVRLFLMVLFLLKASVSTAADLCPTIDFNTLTCGSIGQEVTYEINNYSNVRKITWTIEGGEIIQIGENNDYTAQGFGNSFCQSIGYDWQQATNFTSISYDRTNTGSATFYDNVTHTVKTLSQDGGSFSNNNFAKKITVRWSFGSIKRITVRGEGLGIAGQCGSSQATKDIVITPFILNTFTLTASKTNALCNEGVTISGAPANGDNYNWNTNGGVIQNSWNGGINIGRFTNDGIVPITVTVSNQCSSVSKTITLNITQPDFGHVTQNNTNVDVPGSLVSLDCQGNFSIGMPTFVSNYAVYTWELPGAYNNQTNAYSKIIKSGTGLQNVQGQLPFGSLTDYVGKVTITGVCGAPVIKTFVVRPGLRPTVDQDIYSCSNTVSIKINNPTAAGNINAWVVSTPTGASATITNQTATSAVLTASKAGDYVVNIGVNGANGCYTELQTFVHAGLGGPNATNNAASWQSGVLSDNRQTVGSNIVQYNGNIYFSGRDGKIYFYNYNNALQKWVINQVPGITDAAVPASGTFNKIGAASISGISYLFFTNNTGVFKKINLATNFVDDGLNLNTKSNDFVVATNEIYAIQTDANILLSNQFAPKPLVNATLKTIIPGYGVSYIQNNNLLVIGIALTYALTTTNDVYASSDVVYYNGWVYFARGQKGSANLYRLQISNPSAIEQITTTSNLSGVFSINPASGVIYYGVLNLGAANTITTLTSGTYKAADIYQARLQSTVWMVNKATTAVNYEGLDMYIQSPIYSGNHLYYIGAGRNAATTGNTARELEVWNLYYEAGCAPAVQRIAADPEITSEAEVALYPNPFSTTLSIDLSAYAENGERTTLPVEVIDATGQSVYKASLASQLSEITTADWAPGIYIVKVQYRGTVSNKKVIKF